MSRIANRNKAQSVQFRESAINAMVSNVASGAQATADDARLFLTSIPLSQIFFDGLNPRVELNRDNPELIDPAHPDAEEMYELLDHCKSLVQIIGEVGFAMPIHVRVDRNDPNRYDLIDGHCRWYAQKLTGNTHIPAIEMNHLSDEEVATLRQAENSTRLDIKGFRALKNLVRDVNRSYRHQYKRNNPEATEIPAIPDKDFDALLDRKLRLFSSRTMRHRYRTIIGSASPVRLIFLNELSTSLALLESLAARCKKEPDFYLPIVEAIHRGESCIIGNTIISTNGAHPDVALTDTKPSTNASVSQGAGLPKSQPNIVPPPSGDGGGNGQRSADDFGGFGDSNLIGDGDVAATLNRLNGSSGATASDSTEIKTPNRPVTATPVSGTTNPIVNPVAQLAAKMQRDTEKNRSESRELVVQQPDAIKFLAKTICEQLGIPLPKTQWESSMSGIATLKSLCKQLDQYAADGKLEV